MASSSGNSYSSAATPPQPYSGSEADAQNSSGDLIDQTKRKRMESNRESARRSRMRKQKHLDDLTSQILHLTKENGQIFSGINTTIQHIVSVEAENSILRAQVAELRQRLQSLDEILHFVCSININSCAGINDGGFGLDGPMMSQGDMGYAPRQPIMAAGASGEIDDTYDPSEGNISHIQLPIKESFPPGRGYVSDGRSQVANMGCPISQRSPIHDITGAGSLALSSDLSCTSNNSAELRYVPSPESAAPKKSFASTLSSFPTPLAKNLSLNIDSIPPNPAPSLGQRSPVPQLLRESSDSRIPEIKWPCINSVSEGRPSFVFSPSSNGFPTGSQGGFSGGWSMRTFSELVASSQRESWSFESEQLSSACGKISESNSRFSCSPSFESQTCAVCSKLLTESALFGCRCNEIYVAAVLVCGHLYHGECLEILTLDKDRYDSICPNCTMGEKRMLKMCKKALKAEAERKSRSRKIFNKRSVDGFFGRELRSPDYRKGGEWEGKVPRLEVSSSSKRSFTKPFLSRHLSLRSKWGSSLSKNDSTRKESFWSRSRKE